MRMLLTFYMILNRVFARREKIGAPAVTRQKVLLAILAAAQGRTYTPVQIQKAVFLITRNLPGVVTEGPSFEFSPYDYGPFDASVYQEAEALSKSGLAVISPSGTGRWNVYSATDTGNDSGTEILRKMKTTHREYTAVSSLKCTT